LFKLKNMFNFENCSNSKIVQFQKLFKLKNCSNLKKIQTKKLFKLENCSNSKIVQILNLFKYVIVWKTKKQKKPDKLVNQQKRKTDRKNKKYKRTMDPALPGRGPYASAHGRSLLRRARGRSIGFAWRGAIGAVENSVGG
jgi:hypothetical protein